MTVSFNEMLLRLALALMAGAIIGWERESHGRPAGFRTTILVSTAAAVAMLLSEHLFVISSHGTTWSPDPARLASGVLTGMGFLGAGTILRHQNKVRGVTTAASLWFVTMLGFAFGSGYIALGLVATGLACTVLVLLPRLEGSIRSDWYGSVTVVVDLNGATDEQIREQIQSHGVTVKEMDIEYDVAGKTRTLDCSVKFKRELLLALPQKVVRGLVALPGTLNVKWT